MKILIIGSSGLIGRHLKHDLEARGVDVWCSSRVKNSQIPKQLQLDLLNPRHFDVTEVKKQKFTHLFDCSGVESIKFCEDNPDTSRLLIVKGAKFLAEMCDKLGIAMIYPSTSLVFDGSKNFCKPNEIKQPVCNYAELKSEAEEIVLGSGTKNSVIRFDKVLHPSTAILEEWIFNLRRGEFINAFYDRNLSPICIDTICRCLNLFLKSNLTGLFQLSAVSEISYFEMALRLCQRLNQSLTLVNRVSSVDFGVSSRTYSCLDSSTIWDLDPTLRLTAEECIDSVVDRLIRI